MWVIVTYKYARLNTIYTPFFYPNCLCLVWIWPGMFLPVRGTCDTIYNMPSLASFFFKKNLHKCLERLYIKKTRAYGFEGLKSTSFTTFWAQICYDYRACTSETKCWWRFCVCLHSFVCAQFFQTLTVLMVGRCTQDWTRRHAKSLTHK